MTGVAGNQEQEGGARSEMTERQQNDHDNHSAVVTVQVVEKYAVFVLYNYEIIHLKSMF